MNKIKDFDPLFDIFERMSIGFPRYSIPQNPNRNYPPYNIIKVNENEYTIELAVAGFTKEDLNVAVEKQTLIISGATNAEDKDQDYIHQGIGLRDFKQKFALSENVEISNAKYADGILTIDLVKNIPDEEQPKLISIE